MSGESGTGPLAGVRVVELGGIGAVPFAGMVLADMGADVLRIHRIEAVERGSDPWAVPVLDRGRRSIGVDLKHPDGVACVRRLVASADALLEGFRPGVAERLGLGPDVCLADNPRLVYGRLTGWGQTGPLADAAGHDVNYIAVAGVLAHIGRTDEAPAIPLNLIGDFGGGGLLLALGVVSALFEATRSGQGQVVDAAMIDGAALLMAMMWGMRATGAFHERRGTNALDSGDPLYDVYRTRDDEYVAVAAVEPAFRAELHHVLHPTCDCDRTVLWQPTREELAQLFATRTREEWCKAFDGRDACVHPVLRMSEAAQHPQVRARSTIVEHEGIEQPAPAPRFSRTPSRLGRPAPLPGADTDAALAAWGFSASDIEALHRGGAIRQLATAG